jgi:hypothetical protein
MAISGACLAAGASLAGADEFAGDPADAPSSETFNRIVTKLVLDNLPHEFEDKKKWGMTSHVTTGLRISVDGLKIDTERRKKKVNHGTWRMAWASLANPDEEFHVTVENIHRADDGRLAFQADFAARLHIFGRVSKWVKGVQLFSVSADGEATVLLRVDTRLATELDGRKFPPDVLFRPEVVDARLELTDFRIRRVSQVGGEAADQIGKIIREIVEDKIAERRERLIAKINRELTEEQDRLRLSLHDVLASKWGKWAPSSESAPVIPTPLDSNPSVRP